MPASPSPAEPAPEPAPAPAGPAGAPYPAVVARIRDLVAHAPGRLGVSLRLPGGPDLDLDAEHVVPSASTIKVPLLVAALAACQVGRLDLNQPVPLPAPDERVGGCGPIVLLPSLAALPLREVLALMICLSDNDATNALIDLIGAPAVADVLAAVPTRHTQLQRRLMDFPAAARGLQNLTCAADLADLLVALRSGRLLDAQHTAVAWEVMRGQQFLEGLPAYLPETVRVASKTGSIVGLRADMALLEAPPYDVPGGSSGSSEGGRDGVDWVVVAVVASGLEQGEGEDRLDLGTSVLPTFAQIGAAAAGLLRGTARPTGGGR